MTPRSAAQRTHLHVELAVDGLAFSIHQLERVAAVAVHVPVAVGRAAVREQERHLVGGLRPQADEVPEHVGVLEVSGGVPLLGEDEAGEEDGIPDEEDGGVVANEIPVALLGVELGSEATGVTGGIGGARLASNGREPIDKNMNIFNSHK